MILDHIKNLYRYYEINPGLKIVNDFIKNNHLDKINITEKIRITDDVLIIPISGMQSDSAKKLLEAHREWIDIHCSVYGCDSIVFKNKSECILLETAYNDADDYMLFKDEYEGELKVPQNYFCIITPEMAHMAMCGNTEITKFVFKVRYLID